jgi:hypothetical protein
MSRAERRPALKEPRARLLMGCSWGGWIENIVPPERGRLCAPIRRNARRLIRAMSLAAREERPSRDAQLQEES